MMRKAQKDKPDESKSRFSELISDRMDELGITIQDLADATGASSEHCRRCKRGIGVPDKPLLKVICQILKLPQKSTEELADFATLQKKYSMNTLRKFMGKIPGLEPVERVWCNLTKQQQEDAVAMMVGWAKAAKDRG